jgi:hypothetical protein
VVCFEYKFMSDISHKPTHHYARNQIVRVIEVGWPYLWESLLHFRHDVAGVLGKLQPFNFLRWRSGFNNLGGCQIFWGSEKTSIGVYGHARHPPAGR